MLLLGSHVDACPHDFIHQQQLAGNNWRTLHDLHGTKHCNKSKTRPAHVRCMHVSFKQDVIVVMHALKVTVDGGNYPLLDSQQRHINVRT